MNYESYTDKLLLQYRNALELLVKRIYVPVKHLDSVQGLRTQEHLRVPPTEGLSEIRTGDSWGGRWQNLWLCFDLEIDESMVGKEIWLIPKTGAVEVLCFRNGVPYGIINSKNQEYIGGQHAAMFAATCREPGSYHIGFECYAGHVDAMTGGDESQNVHTFEGVDICVLDADLTKMVFDVHTVLQLADLPEDNFARGKALRALRDAFPYYIQNPRDYSQDELDEAARKVSQALSPALEKREEGWTDGTRGSVMVVGHSHMDSAWLWPYSETIRKCARTYSEVISLMERYPEYTFIQSSALHLDWMERYYPELFAEMSKRIAEGRYEPNGGVWVECDCNVTGGEAMVRQFLYGQKYTREKFGYTSDSFWLPDTFGYNAAIPQIMQGSNVKYFYTTKISWNDLNSVDTDTFRWRGLDGSEVLTHYFTMHQPVDIKDIAAGISGIKDKSTAEDRLVAYGFGDGGGGPTFGMLEALKRNKDLPGLPDVKIGNASAFMAELEKKRDQYPIFDGELYLEFHRGTLTSIHDIKRNNRKGEIALHNMEFVNAASGEAQNPETERLYKELLRNQFHDILPGSSIREVNDTARAEMTAMISEANEITGSYLGKASDTTVSLVNTTSFDWTPADVYEAEGKVCVAGAACQAYTDVMGRDCTAVTGLSVPGYGAAKYAVGCSCGCAAGTSPFTYTGDTLTTPVYEVKFDECGYITSLVDRETGREYCNKGGEPLGTFWMGENIPYSYENWEMSPSLDSKLKPQRKLLSREVVSDGPVELRIRSVYGLGRYSKATVDTVFYAANRAIAYQTKLDWQDERHLLKVGFDVDVRSNVVRNEIQFGHMERPTTRNNSLDTAKYEVVNHKWSDLSDTRGGVALLNDCKYGMSARGGDLRLTLIHGGCDPDPRADKGVHEMSYAILPHVGPFTTEAVIAPAYKFNMPLLLSNSECELTQLVKVDSEHVICETVKCAEDGTNAYVLRLYECEGVPASCTVELPQGAKSVKRVNMLEEVQGEEVLTGNCVKLSVRPFEIVSLYVER